VPSRAQQLALFARDDLAFDESFASVERIELGEGAWVELVRGWLKGDGRLFDELYASTSWRSEERKMYERVVDVPRLFGVLPADGPIPAIVERMRGALNRRYETEFARTGVALYRNGRDSVAWHGDYVARRMPTALVATISLGEPRRFALRPIGGGASIGWPLGFGDLIVMGGSCQRTYQHSVPKVARAGQRIALMLRPVWEEPRS
jgi:alkylated DNA repair dioxygenase AlkB